MPQSSNATADTTLDATGLLCPLPVLKARRALKPLRPGSGARGARDRPRRDQGFRAFLPDNRLRDDRGQRAARRDIAVSAEKAGLTAAGPAGGCSFHGCDDHHAAADGGRRRRARRAPERSAETGARKAADRDRPVSCRFGPSRPRDRPSRPRRHRLEGILRHRGGPDDGGRRERDWRISPQGGFDSLLAIGGGSSIDTAKAMSVLFANGGEMRDYKVPAEIPKAGPPIVAIPTTAGTGSEVTRFTVITDTETDEKMLIAGLACCPIAAIVDYELTLTMPLRLTADTGLDSLTHAIEAYVSRRANPFTDGLAKNAMGLIARHIRTACAEPDNRAAREAMMLGATTAGMAFSNASVCLVHGMSRPIGAFFHVPHGLSNAMLLPEITAFSAPAALERYADCARAMGMAEEGEGSQAAVARLLDELRRLNEDLQVPTPRAGASMPGAIEELLPVMASQALASGSPANNPRVPTSDEIIDLYRARVRAEIKHCSSAAGFSRA